jgi:hypothetical protein
LNSGPAAVYLRLRNFGLHSWRPGTGRCLREPGRSGHYQFVPLHFGEPTGFGGYRKIGRRLPLDAEPLNRPVRVRAQHLVIRPVIVNHIILNGDVRDVHRVINVGNILHSRSDVTAQNRFADVTDLAEIIIFRADIVLDVYLRTDRRALINDTRSARRQRRPADVITASPPRNPCGAPVQILSGKPDPAITRKIRPAAIMISGPAEILVRNPCPSVIRVSPVPVGVGTPVRIVYG